MAVKKDDAPPATNDAYTGMLAISLLALIGGCVLLYLDYSQYPDSKGPTIPKAPGIVTGKDGPAKVEPPPKAEPAPKNEPAPKADAAKADAAKDEPKDAAKDAANDAAKKD